MQRTIPAILLVFISASSFAATKITLGFPDGSDKIVFESAAWPKGDPSSSRNYKAQKVDYTIESTNKSDQIFVVDVASNTVASKPIGEIQNNTWTLTQADFKNVYKLKIEVSAPKGPISAATVDLEDASGKRTELIDPSSTGVATFSFVKQGDVKVAVNYKADGKTKDPVRQSFTVGGDKDSTLKIALPDGEAIPSATPAANNAPAGNSSKEKEKDKDKDEVDTGKNPAGNLIMTIISLAIVGGVGYWIIQYMKKNPDRVKDTLTKLGADIPQPPDPNQGAHDPNPIAPIAPQPMQQIILDPNAPPPGPVPSSIPMGGSAGPIIQSAPTGVPKLIATDGSAFELPEGETVVGREFGNGLVVPNDTVSRKHATLLKMGTSVELQDHGSTNGTWVNGAKVNGSQSLRPGDAVRFGSIEYRYEG